MSSNIKVQRICQYCGNEFTARTIITQYCSHDCNRKAYKAKLRDSKIEISNNQTQFIKTQPIEQLKAKEFLTVRDVSKLLNCSIRTSYRLIEQKKINAVNLAERKTLVRRSDIDKLFEQPQQNDLPKQAERDHVEIEDCYHLTEIQEKFGISESGVQQLIKRYQVPKIKEGKFAYVPKIIIDRIIMKPNTSK